MSLPQAMAALQRGEIVAPTDAGSVGALLPARPIIATPAPQRRLTEHAEIEAQRRQNEIDEREMQLRLRAKEIKNG